MRKDIFNAVAHALSHVPGVEFVDLWNNQVEQLNGGAAFPLVAVFIEFEIIEWKQLNRHARRGDVALRLHVVSQAVHTNGHRDPAIHGALRIFSILDDITLAMQSLHIPGCSSFMLTTSATNHNHLELVENIERFICSCQTPQSPPIQPIPAPAISLKVNK